MYAPSIFSAALLFLSYIAPQYYCWTSLLFLIPLYICIGPRIAQGRQGFVWGLLFYGAHLHPIAGILYTHGCGEYRMFVYPLLIIFLAVQAGFWFWCVYIFSKISHFAWPAITIVYFIWMQTMVFWVFDVQEGYPFALPIIPLAYYQGFMAIAPLIGVYGCTALLILAQWHIAQYYISRRAVDGLVAMFCYSIFFIGFAFPLKDESTFAEQAIIHSFVSITPPVFEGSCNNYPIDYAQEIAYKLQKGTEQYPHKNWFVLPESAFPFELEVHYINMWQPILDNNSSAIIIGAHKKAAKTRKNCIFHIKTSRIIQTYEKKHLCIFTERAPFLMKHIKPFAALFKNTSNEYNNYSLCGTYSLFYMAPTLYILPVLCSEFFFNDFSSLPYNKVPILLLCNDSWFITNQMKCLMYLYAKIYAIAYKRPILYVSHTKTTLFSQTGRAHDVSTIA